MSKGQKGIFVLSAGCNAAGKSTVINPKYIDGRIKERKKMDAAKNLDFEEEKVKKNKTPPRPLRRYGIEVDRVEDVGISIMCGVYPQKCMTREEYLSIPEEIRDKAIAEMERFFDNSETTFPAAIKRALREQLERGTPISYSDGNGKVLRRYPDGKIFLADVDMETFEKTEVFLRMATPEDDIGIYD